MYDFLDSAGRWHKAVTENALRGRAYCIVGWGEVAPTQKQLSMIDGAMHQGLPQEYAHGWAFYAQMALLDLSGAGAFLKGMDDGCEIDALLFQGASRPRLRTPVFGAEHHCVPCGEVMHIWGTMPSPLLVPVIAQCATIQSAMFFTRRLRKQVCFPEREKANLLPECPVEGGLPAVASLVAKQMFGSHAIQMARVRLLTLRFPPACSQNSSTLAPSMQTHSSTRTSQGNALSHISPRTYVARVALPHHPSFLLHLPSPSLHHSEPGMLVSTHPLIPATPHMAHVCRAHSHGWTDGRTEGRQD